MHSSFLSMIKGELKYTMLASLLVGYLTRTTAVDCRSEMRRVTAVKTSKNIRFKRLISAH